MFDFDFWYDMVDSNGFFVTVYGDHEGIAYVEYFDLERCKRRTKTCERGEAQAYMWAYDRGYRIKP